MKGDDCLLFSLNDPSEKVIVGEAKFRVLPDKKSVLDIIKNLEGQKRLPVSIPFVIQCLEGEGKEELVEQLEELLVEIHRRDSLVVNVGFLLGSTSSTPSKDAYSSVEKHLECSNQNMVFVSLGIDSPDSLIEESFKYATELYYDTPFDLIEKLAKAE